MVSGKFWFGAKVAFCVVCIILCIVQLILVIVESTTTIGPPYTAGIFGAVGAITALLCWILERRSNQIQSQPEPFM